MNLVPQPFYFVPYSRPRGSMEVVNVIKYFPNLGDITYSLEQISREDLTRWRQGNADKPFGSWKVLVTAGMDAEAEQKRKQAQEGGHEKVY